MHWTRTPWLLPFTAALVNLFVLLATLLTEGRIKPNVLRFTIAHMLAIAPAARGDLTPFYLLLGQS